MLRLIVELATFVYYYRHHPLVSFELSFLFVILFYFFGAPRPIRDNHSIYIVCRFYASVIDFDSEIANIFFLLLL